MRGYLRDDGLEAPGDLFPTGDLVREEEGRVYFLGRRGELINVGGNKVSPGQVEAVILGQEGVCAARVSGASSSLAGQIVRAEIVPDGSVDPGELRRRVLRECRARLLPFMVPRKLEFVLELPQTASGKLVRR